MLTAFCEMHKSAVASGVEYEGWFLEQAMEMTADYLRQKEDAKFEEAFARANIG